MKGGTPANDLRMSLQPAAALSSHLLQLVKRAKGAIGKRFIGERPQTFCGLKLRRMGGQKEQVQPFGNSQLGTLVPARLICDHKHVFVRPHALLLGKGGERQRKSGRIDRGHEQPPGRAAVWVHKAIQIHPLIAWSDHGPHSGPLAIPNAAQNRFETNAVLILAPQFNGGFWVRFLQLFDLLGEFF